MTLCIRATLELFRIRKLRRRRQKRKRREVGNYLFIYISPELKQLLQRSSLANLSMAIGRADHFTIQNRYHKPQQRKG